MNAMNVKLYVRYDAVLGKLQWRLEDASSWKEMGEKPPSGSYEILDFDGKHIILHESGSNGSFMKLPHEAGPIVSSDEALQLWFVSVDSVSAMLSSTPTSLGITGTVHISKSDGNVRGPGSLSTSW